MRTLAPRFALSFALALAGSGLTATADAEKVQLGGPGQTIQGEQVFDEVEVISELKVQPYNGSSGGWLHIKSNLIEVDVNGIIDANGAGYQGTKMAATAAGQGPGFGNTAMLGDPALPLPGGGGAHISNGGNGFLNTNMNNEAICEKLDGSEGGMAHTETLDLLNLSGSPLGFGSAGGFGRADSTNQGFIDAGGSGGGLIILEAHTVNVQGLLQANGNDAISPLTTPTGAGGGAGGTIVIVANVFKFGDNTRLSAAGGKGNFGTTVGGGGSGGRIALVAGAELDISAIEARISFNGNGSVGTQCTSGPNGGNGVLEKLDPPSCIDADDDGVSSAACGGMDCNDGDPLIRPDAAEVCDGVDNNCDGQIDEASSPNLCNAGSGEVCIDGLCEDPTDGEGGSGGKTIVELPTRLELRGGLCASIAPGSPDGERSPGKRGMLAAMASLLAAAVLRRRR